MRRITARTKLTFVSLLPPAPSPGPVSPVSQFYTRTHSTERDNARLENRAFGDTTQQVSTECPDTDLEPDPPVVPINASSSPFAIAADPLVSPLWRSRITASCFHEKRTEESTRARMIIPSSRFLISRLSVTDDIVMIGRLLTMKDNRKRCANVAGWACPYAPMDRDVKLDR